MDYIENIVRKTIWGQFQHILVNHVAWYVKQYESLEIWSNQRMKKLHHNAKSSQQHHIQHDGTARRTSVIIQTYQHWHYNIQLKFARKG